MCSFMTEALDRIRQAPYISYCLLNGPAIGGGAELTTACDFRLIDSDNLDKTYIRFVQANMGLTPGIIIPIVVLLYQYCTLIVPI
jgi:ethylmalonyl-CoA/methylmalonyl-CoA decarboxylase